MSTHFCFKMLRILGVAAVAVALDTTASPAHADTGQEAVWVTRVPFSGVDFAGSAWDPGRQVEVFAQFCSNGSCSTVGAQTVTADGSGNISGGFSLSPCFPGANTLFASYLGYYIPLASANFTSVCIQ
jgi:hypothetical protein